MFEKEMTVGQLKEFLNKYPNETKIISISSNYEMNNSKCNAIVSEIRCTKEVKQFRDDFDGTIYSAQIYNYDDNGEITILIKG